MNYFDHHETFTLLFLALFPRLTLLIGSFSTGGVLWWLGWVFCPRLLVAILALPYWDHNPVLVIIAWIVAFSGSTAESKTAYKATR